MKPAFKRELVAKLRKMARLLEDEVAETLGRHPGVTLADYVPQSVLHGKARDAAVLRAAADALAGEP